LSVSHKHVVWTGLFFIHLVWLRDRKFPSILRNWFPHHQIILNIHFLFIWHLIWLVLLSFLSLYLLIDINWNAPLYVFIWSLCKIIIEQSIMNIRPIYQSSASIRLLLYNLFFYSRLVRSTDRSDGHSVL